MDTLIRHFKVWEKVFMALGLISAMAVGIVNAREGNDFNWQIVTILWIVTCWIKTNKINELEN